jgi:hypothetical protein
MNAKTISLVLTVALPLVLAACPTDTKPPNPPAALTPIIPETTKVADPATRTALSSYDPASGTMRYAQSTPVIANLKTDDVIVSEPSSAAPNGYLRKVKAIRKEGDAVVLETTQAGLTDAISQGSLNAQADLKPSDLRSATPLLKGVNAGIAPQIGVGDRFDYEVNFDNTMLDLGEGDVKAKIQVSGKVRFNAGYGVSFDITGPSLFPPRLPSLGPFEASVGFEQSAQLRVSGDANARLDKRKLVAEYFFKPKCFPILGVPVCVVPTIFVFVGASGEVSLGFHYAADETARAKIGARWTEDDGWEKIDPTPILEATFDQSLDVNGAYKAKVYAQSEIALQIFGVAGPTIGAKVGFELDAAIPRDPFWIMRASLEAYYGLIVDVPVFGRVAEKRDTLYEIVKEFGRSPNSPPKIIVLEPNKRVELGQSVNLSFAQNNGQYYGLYYVVDPEEGTPNFTLTSDLDGALPHGFTPYTFATPGLRTITVRASDSHGASSSGSFKIDVVNAPPVAYGSVGSDTVPQTVPYYISAAATDSNSKIDCSALSWSVTAPDTVEPANINNEVCYGRAVFNVKGPRTVTLVARDPQGAVSPPRTFSVLVTDPPAIPAPEFTLSVKGCVLSKENSVCTVKEIPEGADVVFGNPIMLSAIPKVAASLGYTFQAECLDCSTRWYKFWPSGTGIEEYNPEQAGTWQFIVKASNGTIFTASRTIRVVPTPPR